MNSDPGNLKDRQGGWGGRRMEDPQAEEGGEGSELPGSPAW